MTKSYVVAELRRGSDLDTLEPNYVFNTKMMGNKKRLNLDKMQLSGNFANAMAPVPVRHLAAKRLTIHEETADVLSKQLTYLLR